MAGNKQRLKLDARERIQLQAKMNTTRVIPFADKLSKLMS